MFITDAQVHTWGANTAEHPWSRMGRSAEKAGGKPFGAAEIIAALDGGGVARAVVIPPSWSGTNAFALEAASAHPTRLGVMGMFDFDNGGVDEVKTWRDQPGMLGVRMNFRQKGVPEQLVAGRFDWFFDAADAAGVPLMVLAPGQASIIGDVAKRHPGLRLIIDHLNLERNIRDETIGPALDDLLTLKGLPNVAAKVSALPLFVSEAYPFPSLGAHIQRVVEGFGIERCMWGSDLTRLPCAYADWVRTLTEDADYLSASDKEQLMNGTLSNWLDWHATTS